jgi:antitoxin component of MazEF toxin-antitoxin module
MLRKTKDNSLRKLMRLGKTSLGITLPVALLDQLGWREKQKLTVKRIKGGLVVRDWHSK